MTTSPGCRSDPSGTSITHPGHPLVDDKTAVLIDQATVELTLLRSPAALGDSLADLHAMVSLLAQLHAWIPVAVAGARGQHHSWAAIAAQLQITPATARRRHHGRPTRCPPAPDDRQPCEPADPPVANS
jgi:hypothetical protein